jgi:hypothetical protein
MSKVRKPFKNQSKHLRLDNTVIDSGGKAIFYKGGRRNDRNMDTWEDKRQDAYLKKLEEIRAKSGGRGS